MTSRLLPLAAGLVLVLATGLVHGLWTQRWAASQELEAAAARLEAVPETVGPWTSEPVELDPRALAQAGARGSVVRSYTNGRTGARVLMILLCGRPGPISVHRPEHCYRGAGYDMTGPAQRRTLRCGPARIPAEFWTARFRRSEETRTVRLGIFWSWFAGRAWEAPASPRVTFAQVPALYKLYVIRELPPTGAVPEEDPGVEFLRAMVPELVKVLSPPTESRGPE